MSFLNDINCSTILEAIKQEKERIRQELDNKTDEYIDVNPSEGAFWTDLFANCFLCYENNTKNNLSHDDMFFFVSRVNSEDSKIEVYRRDSKKLPCLTDFNYDWEETVYLNLILHEFEYTLTCAICTQTRSKDLEILKRHSKRVYASPSQRDLKSKGEEEVITYPNIFFTVDDFDDAFNEMIVKEGEMVCVELIAGHESFRKVLFLGSIKYEALKKVYDARASTGAKIVQKMTLGKMNEKRVEFVKMKGPGGKGYAEMAVSRFIQKEDLASQVTSPVDEKSNEQLNNLFNNNNPVTSDKNTRLNLLQNRLNLFGKTLGQAFSMLKIPMNRSEETESNENDEEISPNFPTSISLNAYLTYVTLNLSILMQSLIETRQKALLTF
ncbi:unnamed protein product [Brachionus calyciflorus]|uniref:KIAA0930 n=1 Tax=Brachionus calyciflorus TaxID=104777 RepID=A0A814BHV6_9BILA|nr:unnamed protein product [Brachionus calyciflorus]